MSSQFPVCDFCHWCICSGKKQNDRDKETDKSQTSKKRKVLGLS